jgi:hypothetical protein
MIMMRALLPDDDDDDEPRDPLAAGARRSIMRKWTTRARRVGKRAMRTFE